MTKQDEVAYDYSVPETSMGPTKIEKDPVAIDHASADVPGVVTQFGGSAVPSYGM